MQSNRILLILLIVLVMLNTGLIYLHFFSNRHFHKHAEHSKESWLDGELGLTDAQEAKHVNMRKEYFQKLGVLNDTLRCIKARFVAKAANFDLTDSLSTVWTDSINRWHRRADELTYLHVRNVRAILDSTQQPRWDSLIQVMIMKKSRE